jgi:hypothetical protein
MLKYITEKLVGQILPSVVATVIGAYVVNQYINKPATPASHHAGKIDDSAGGAKPVEAALTASTPDADKADSAKLDQAKPKAQAAEKPSLRHAVTQRDKAADKAAADKLAADKATADKAAADRLAAEKAAAKPAVAAVAPEPAKPQDERREANRDPNDVLRAAVERLRASEPARPTEVTARTPDSLKPPEPPKVQEAPRSVALQPLPPAVNIATPAAPASITTGSSVTGSVPSGATADASFGGPRLSPPADIPSAAEMRGDAPGQKPSVAEDVLLAAKSVFHAVLPR